MGNLDSNVIYQDDSVLVVNKPNSLLTHHSYYARNIHERSLAEQIREHYGDKIYPVHRLDRKTSGIVLIAKTAEAAKLIQSQFDNGTVQKEYTALVRGFVPEMLEITSPIKNDKSGNYQEAHTSLSLIESVTVDIPVEPYPTSRYSLVHLSPRTGRTHQLRKHMNKIAHPIIGDTKHGNRQHNRMFEAKFEHGFLYLHANRLIFHSPGDETEIEIKAPFPEFWKQDLRELGFNTGILSG